MGSTSRIRTTVGMVLGGLVAGLLLSVGSSSPTEARTAASLHVSPGTMYVGGQLVTFSGNLGVRGVRRIHLELDMGEGLWPDVEGFRARTKADGSFRFRHPAPSMFNIRLRVASRGVATPAHTFNARSQDLTLDLRTDGPLGPGQVLAGVPFVIDVDTTPTLPHRPDLPGPAFPGRVLRLEKQVGARWAEVEQLLPGTERRVDEKGNGRFVVPGLGLSTSSETYRVVAEDWTVGGNEVGWYPSFPLEVEVLDALPLRTRGAEEVPAARTSRPTPRTPAAKGAVPAVTASKAYGWGMSLWDFAWEYGESLTSRPYRGTEPRGWWQERTTGSGRVAKHNGGLSLDSQRNWSGPGDVGSMFATLRGNPMRYGRWETRLRIKRMESGARDYHARIELVPDRARDDRCGTPRITVADVAIGGSRLGYGVTSRSGRSWSANGMIRAGDTAPTFAVEVTRRHITWFLNGKPTGTVRSGAAVPDVPLTMRLSLVGDGRREMNHTRVYSDWQRAWSLKNGKRVAHAAALPSRRSAAGC